MTTDRLILREILLEDLNAIHTLHSLPEVDKYNTLGVPDSIQETQSLLNNWVEDQTVDPRVKYIFSISDIKSKEFIGLTGINIGKPEYRTAEIWYKLHPKNWHKGYATETVKKILQFCFTDLNLHRIEAGCAVDNAASIKVLEKSGFLREGRKRKILPIRGQWVDNYFYAILKEDHLL